MPFAACQAVGSYLACLGNYLESAFAPRGERSSPVQTKHTVFIWVYGFSASFLAVVYISNIILCASLTLRPNSLCVPPPGYASCLPHAHCACGRATLADEAGTPPALPAYVTQCADLLWIACINGIM